jgi:hypothetical protein
VVNHTSLENTRQSGIITIKEECRMGVALIGHTLGSVSCLVFLVGLISHGVHSYTGCFKMIS